MFKLCETKDINNLDPTYLDPGPIGDSLLAGWSVGSINAYLMVVRFSVFLVTKEKKFI